MINKGLMSSNSDEWATPKELFKKLNAEFHFTLDPCADNKNATCENFFTKHDSGLLKEWRGNVFMNPPYGRKISLWIKKAYDESAHCLVVALIPARTDTRYFHDYIYKKKGVKIRFLKGRLRFSEKGPAPFPSMLIIFDRRKP